MLGAGMRILFVTARFPFPPLKGDQVVVVNRLRRLAVDNDVHLVTFAERPPERESLRELEQYCRSVDVVVLPKLRSILNVAFWALFSQLPLQILYFRSRAFRRTLSSRLAQERFDVVHAYSHRVVPFVEDLGVPAIADLIDSIQLLAERNVENERGFGRILWSEELRRIRRFEKRVHERFPSIIVVSEQDRALIAGNNVEVIPNGVDHEAFAPKPDVREPATIVFSGNMSYAPNVHAAQWFTSEVLPHVLRAAPDARFSIVGASPPRAVRILARLDRVEVTGFVPSMADALNRAASAVAPMVSGSGIQNKILEAMSCAVPVVATPIGRGGIPAGEEHGLVVASTPSDFAAAVAGLLADPARARELGESGRAFVLEHYTWDRNAEQVEAIYRATVRRG
jgi:sugar transferase (PEP-CTERM/EpsH1 system associated)